MGLSALAGSFAMATVTGNQAVTGVGFQPKALILLCEADTSDGLTTTAGLISVGMADISGHQSCVASHASDTTHPGSKIIMSATVMATFPADGSVIIDQADFVSMDADGFTIHWSSNGGTARILTYLALGGSDITDVDVTFDLSATSTGNRSVTGATFLPDAMLCVSAVTTTINLMDTFGNSFVWGAANGSSQVTLGGAYGGTTASTQQLTDHVFVYPKEDASGIYLRASFVSFDFSGGATGGYTLNWDTVLADNREFMTLMLKGANLKIGSFSQATSTGNQAVTGVGATPVATLLASIGFPSGTTIQTTSKIGLGLATSSSQRSHTWFQYDNATRWRDLDRAEVYKTFSPATTSPTTVADFVSNDSNGFTVNNTTVDATSREILYVTAGVSGKRFLLTPF